MKKLLLVLIGVLVFTACGDDDESSNTTDNTSEPPRLLSEVALENDAEIQAFLQTHFYNYEEFETAKDAFDFRVQIDTISGMNADKIPLSQQVKSVVINVSSNEFTGLEEENDVPHTLYYLEVRAGEGGQPTIADSTFVSFEGLTLDLNTFDGSKVPEWFDLSQLHSPEPITVDQDFRGLAEGITKFKSGGEIVVDSLGAFSVQGYGIGLMIFPSGLGNFNNSDNNIAAYSPLIYTVGLHTLNMTDHDSDGIPSIMEDLNANNFLYDDNTDETFESENIGILTVNFLDSDDDGDGILTRTEISDADGNIIVPYPNTGGGDLPDYLNPDILRNPK